MLFVSGLLITQIFLGLFTFLIDVSSYTQKCSQNDRRVALIGEEFAAAQRRLLQINELLRLCYLKCPAVSALPPALAALQAEAQSLAAAQELQMLASSSRATILSSNGISHYQRASRLSPGPCSLPGLLHWQDPKVYLFFNSVSGIEVVTKAPLDAYWYYSHHQVKSL